MSSGFWSRSQDAVGAGDRPEARGEQQRAERILELAAELANLRKRWRMVVRVVSDVAQLGANVFVGHETDPAVVGAQRADADFREVDEEERGGEAVERRGVEPADEEVLYAVAFDQTTEENGNQAAGEQQLARRAQLGVANAPFPVVAAAALALEVDADRLPIADDVVEEEAWRTKVLDSLVEVAVEDLRDGDRARLARVVPSTRGEGASVASDSCSCRRRARSSC